ncbi:hypothetical protein RR46_05142 [Papilio xuthus]|uniref:Uncharacterized protein n=1 Tax=Papilio xuthus TaxID=66420 RepID=A0A194Q8T5_PAPXU|nr:hypothetical protein RR46_05142 [Papilio xuthus]
MVIKPRTKWMGLSNTRCSNSSVGRGGGGAEPTGAALLAGGGLWAPPRRRCAPEPSAGVGLSRYRSLPRGAASIVAHCSPTDDRRTTDSGKRHGSVVTASVCAMLGR